MSESGRNRTFNLWIKSPLLCQLSYAPSASQRVSVCGGAVSNPSLPALSRTARAPPRCAVGVERARGIGVADGA